jgi:hypothetical protein
MKLHIWCVIGLVGMVRDRADGVLCTAHVPRRRSSTAASSFTSLCRAPHRPDRETPWLFGGPTAPVYHSTRGAPPTSDFMPRGWREAQWSN